MFDEAQIKEFKEVSSHFSLHLLQLMQMKLNHVNGDEIEKAVAWLKSESQIAFQ